MQSNYVNGLFQLWNNSEFLVSVTASGNARQRRRKVRLWKRMGYRVKQLDVVSRVFKTL